MSVGECFLRTDWNSHIKPWGFWDGENGRRLLLRITSSCEECCSPGSAEPGSSQYLPFPFYLEPSTAPLQVGVQRDPGLEVGPEQKQWVSFLAVKAVHLTSLLGLHPGLSYSIRWSIVGLRNPEAAPP